MKEVEACQRSNVPFMPLQKRDLNAMNNDRHHKIAKLKADLNKINIRKPDTSSQTEKLPTKQKTVKNSLNELRGVNLEKIQAHLHSIRSKNKVECDPFTKQTEVNRIMRATLFNWLLEVATKFQLNPRTIFLCAHIFDRYLTKTNIEKKNLQLLGITCLYIAAKFEDVQPPRIRDLCFLCNDIYKPDDILLLEGNILSSLNFDLIFVSAYDVVEINMALNNIFNVNTNNLVMFILYTFLIQGTISMVDSFKLASFTCTLVQRYSCREVGALNYNDISGIETGKLEQCLNQMFNVIKKYRLSALEKDLSALPHNFLLL